MRVERLGVRACRKPLIEGAALTVARRVPVPQLLALDGHHRPGAAGVGAGVVRRRVGVRLHAEHDVAARAVARHRHPHRRRDRGAREHRAARGDGEGPSQGRLRGHRRDRPGGHRDDAVDRRGVHPDCVPGRGGRAVVQAVRPDDRLLGAGVAVRVVLARPDALGVLARSAQAARAAAAALARPRPLQSLVRSPRRELQGRDCVGARPSRRRWWRWRLPAFVGALALPAMGIVGAGFVPEMDESDVLDRSRDAAGLEPRVHAAEGAGGRAHRPHSGRKSPTPTPRSADRATPWTRASCS